MFFYVFVKVPGVFNTLCGVSRVFLGFPTWFCCSSSSLGIHFYRKLRR